LARLPSATTWIVAKHEPSLMARKLNPPPLVRTVRTHPASVTWLPGARSFNAFLISVRFMVASISNRL
jgi:hypothetical protein